MNILVVPSKLYRVLLISAALCLLSVTSATSAGNVDELYQAAGNGDSAKVSVLLDSGVDVNGRTDTGSFALNNAAVENEVEIMQILLDRGADPNVQNSQGDTPLICATKYAGGKAATVKILIEAGTNLAIKDAKGNTALDYAKAKDQQGAIALLEQAAN